MSSGEERGHAGRPGERKVLAPADPRGGGSDNVGLSGRARGLLAGEDRPSLGGGERGRSLVAKEGLCRDQALPRALGTLENDGGIMKPPCGGDEWFCSNTRGPPRLCEAAGHVAVPP